MNAAAELIFGYSASEAIGRHISLIIPKDRWPRKKSRAPSSRRKIDHWFIRQRSIGRRSTSLTVSRFARRTANIIGVEGCARRHRAERLPSRAGPQPAPLPAALAASLWEQDFRRQGRDRRRMPPGLRQFPRVSGAPPEFIDHCLELVDRTNRLTLRMLGARGKRELSRVWRLLTSRRATPSRKSSWRAEAGQIQPGRCSRGRANRRGDQHWFLRPEVPAIPAPRLTACWGFDGHHAAPSGPSGIASERCSRNG